MEVGTPDQDCKDDVVSAMEPEQLLKSQRTIHRNLKQTQTSIRNVGSVLIYFVRFHVLARFAKWNADRSFCIVSVQVLHFNFICVFLVYL